MRLLKTLFAIPLVLIVMLPAAVAGVAWGTLEFSFQHGRALFWKAVVTIQEADNLAKMNQPEYRARR